MKWITVLFLLLAASAMAQTTLFPSNGMARWHWNGTAWVGCTATASGNPTDKFPALTQKVPVSENLSSITQRRTAQAIRAAVVAETSQPKGTAP